MYKHKAILNFSNPDGATLTDFQTKFSIPRMLGMKADFSNLRFENVFGVRCPHWIESYNATSADVWVRIPIAGTHGTALVMLWGGDENLSNPDEVFYFYDDFSTADKWTSNSSYLYIDTANKLLKCTYKFRSGGKIVIDDTLDLGDFILEYDATADGVYGNTEMLLIGLSPSSTPVFSLSDPFFGSCFYGGSSADADASNETRYTISSTPTYVGKFYHGNWTKYNYQFKRIGTKFSYLVTLDSNGSTVVSGSNIDCDDTTLLKLFLARRDSVGGVATDIYSPLKIRSPNTSLSLDAIQPSVMKKWWIFLQTGEYHEAGAQTTVSVSPESSPTKEVSVDSECTVVVSPESSVKKTVSSGSQDTVSIDTNGEIKKEIEVGSEATNETSTESSFKKAVSIGSQSTVQTSSQGLATKSAAVGSEASIEVSPQGSISKKLSAGSEETVSVDPQSSPKKTVALSVEAETEIEPEGAAKKTVKLGSQTTVQISSEGAFTLRIANAIVEVIPQGAIKKAISIGSDAEVGVDAGAMIQKSSSLGSNVSITIEPEGDIRKTISNSAESEIEIVVEAAGKKAVELHSQTEIAIQSEGSSLKIFPAGAVAIIEISSQGSKKKISLVGSESTVVIFAQGYAEIPVFSVPNISIVKRNLAVIKAKRSTNISLCKRSLRITITRGG